MRNMRKRDFIAVMVGGYLGKKLVVDVVLKRLLPRSK